MLSERAAKFFENQSELIQSELCNKSFEEKIEWFQSHKEPLPAEVSYALDNEDHLCYVIARHRIVEDENISVDDVIEIQMELFKNVLGRWEIGATAKGFTAKEAATIRKRLNYLNQRKRNKDKEQKYFNWHGDANSELPDLYSRLVPEFVSQETKMHHFIAVLSGQNCKDLYIKWADTNRLLAFFLGTVFKEQNWQAITGKGNFFKNKKGKFLTAGDLSYATSESKKFGLPDGHKKITEILSAIKNPKKPKRS